DAANKIWQIFGVTSAYLFIANLVLFSISSYLTYLYLCHNISGPTVLALFIHITLYVLSWGAIAFSPLAKQ
ncbi:MAG: hypothetical protein Q4G59_12540, partial [Planctomycetia bacterium]|nr:hypothetical protein [Planctomycetia bacterium]